MKPANIKVDESDELRGKCILIGIIRFQWIASVENVLKSFKVI